MPDTLAVGLGVLTLLELREFTLGVLKIGLLQVVPMNL